MKVKSLITLTASLALIIASGCKKEAKPGQLESLQFKQTSYEILETEQDLYLRKEIRTVPADIIDTAKIAFSDYDETVASIDNSYVRPRRSGTINVTATIQGKSTSCVINIKQVPVKGIELEDFSVALNGTAQTKATIKPSGISRDRLTWSIDKPEIATIDSKTGVVTGKTEGTATVTATADDAKGTCTLSVKKKLVTRVEVTPGSGRLYKLGDKLQLEAKVEPSDASFPEVTWSSSAPDIVSVDKNGLVTAKKYPNDDNPPVVITAKADNQRATCNVTLWPQQATKILLNAPSYKFTEIGESFDLYIWRVEPTERTLEDVYQWYTMRGDTKICSINGKSEILSTKLTRVSITCNAPGKETIRCMDDWSGAYADCEVELPLVPITGITLSTTSTLRSITDGKFVVSASVTPAKANEEIKWEVTSKFSDVGAATITPSKNGRSAEVTPTQVGHIIVKASSSKASSQIDISIVEGKGTVTDCQGHTYQTVKIGNQWWMAENMDCAYYDTNSEGTSNLVNFLEVYATNSFPPYYYRYSSSSFWNDWSSKDKEKAGRLYNWAAAVGIATESIARDQQTDFNKRRQGICPNNWHLPTVAEMTTLYNYVSSNALAADSWYGNDKYGFYALPTCTYSPDNRDYDKNSKYCYFWTASAISETSAKVLYLKSARKDIYTGGKREFYSVRCVRNY